MKDRVECRTPTPGKKPVTIEAAKFAAFRKAILKVLPKRGEGVLFEELVERVAPHLPPDIGSLPWYVTTVKLELEVRGEIVRVPAAKPQRLLKAGATAR
ncbi:MAG: hypothetical protein FJW30_07740 [Acidobacteria bacterium]|nr:hypothetical protein [Acidobacteriota bacterium]